MSIADIITNIQNGWFGWLILAMTIIQIVPIQVNPWSFIMRNIGKALNRELSKKVDNLTKDVNSLREEIDEREADNCRTRILRFNDELSHDVKHSKEHFDQTLWDITKYETYCKNHPGYKNNIASIAIDRIKSIYRQCVDEDTFL